jgi:hypothetical protein
VTDPHGLPIVAVAPPEDELDALLRDLQLAVLRHPVAAQAIFQTLVAEGRRYAATSEGQLLRTQLASSPLARRLHQAWDVGTLNALDPDPGGPYPTDFVDLVFAASTSGRPPLAGTFPGTPR